MTPTEQLKAILNEKYISEDDDEYKIELKPGLTDQQTPLMLTASVPAESPFFGDSVGVEFRIIIKP